MPRGRHERSAEVTNVSGDTPRPASVYLKPEAIYHARCEQPLTLTGYFSSTEELHFRCSSCGESICLPPVAGRKMLSPQEEQRKCSIFLPAVAVERIERR